ncbi:MAG: D-arabinono-1,4-lactone oxidase [Cyanobacteria bacterium J06627_28]
MTITTPKKPVQLSENIKLSSNFSKKRKTFLSGTHLHRFSPESVVFADCEADIVAAVKQAASQNKPVRAIGAMHSYAPIFATAGTCLVLERYNRLLKVENTQVTVQAGITLERLNQHLAAKGLALPICSAIALQTISGAISTGSHGGSYYHPSLSGYVRQLRLVRADSSVVELNAKDDNFGAAVVSMGLLGIISTVTIDCVPAFWLVAERQPFSATDFITQFDSIHRSNQYLDVKYIPITDGVQVLKMNKTVSQSANSHHSDTSQFQSPKLIRKIKTEILKRMLALFQRPNFTWLQRWMYRRHENNIYPDYRSDRSDHIFTHLEYLYYDPILLHNMEIAVPYHQGTAVLQTLRSHFQQTRQYPNIFIRIRVSAADDCWLSPAYNEATCWFDFCEYPYSGQFFREIVDLLTPFNFRSHWGKEIQATPAYVRTRYEKWTEFMALRDRWDPHRRFTNDSLKRFFSDSLAFCNHSSDSQIPQSHPLPHGASSQ